MGDFEMLWESDKAETSETKQGHSNTFLRNVFLVMDKTGKFEMGGVGKDAGSIVRDRIICEPGRVETLGLRHKPMQPRSVPVRFISDL